MSALNTRPLDYPWNLGQTSWNISSAIDRWLAEEIGVLWVQGSNSFHSREFHSKRMA